MPGNNRPTFSHDEEEEFAQAALDRDNHLKREYAYFGSYMSPRQKLWEEEQQRKRNAAAEAGAESFTAWAPQPPTGASYDYQTNDDASPEQYAEIAAQYSPSLYSEYNDSPQSPIQETARLRGQSDYRSGNMTMTQLRTNRCNIEMHSSTIGWQGMKAVLDTGADENWISREIVESLSLAINKGVVFRYKTVDGSELISGATVAVRWGIQGRSKTDVAEFRVVTNGTAPFDVLLGNNLITSNQINFNDEERPHGVIVGPEETQAEKQEAAESSQASQQEIKALNEQRKTQKDRKKDRSTKSSNASRGGSKHSSGKSK
ncbi:uncharacterized protein PAC_01153 [Phialocephala subalpina]|uniref:Uncharacterized protein n=1 Tax=Phialocephala subalpina TaxID=576137 RepID=A0A1L7WEW4_9HELO|nr:uncharacterized protein PAC_01153 [Phialocephala subalpina]